MARVERATRAGVLSVLAACVLCLAAIAPSTSIATPAYTAEHSAYRSHARFVVTYEGLGVWSTAYHSEPPNDGGDHDTNDAHDLGVQSWNLLFGQTVVVDRCGPRKGGQPDRCSVLQGLSGATGATTAIGSIDHKHVDGLYRQLDMAAIIDSGMELLHRHQLVLPADLALLFRVLLRLQGLGRGVGLQLVP